MSLNLNTRRFLLYALDWWYISICHSADTVSLEEEEEEEKKKKKEPSQHGEICCSGLCLAQE
jgi:hypothetical protein